MKKLFSFLCTFALLAFVLPAVFPAEASAETPMCFFGTVDGQTYTNEFFDLRFEGSEGWELHDGLTAKEVVPYTQETIASLEDLCRVLSENGIAYDLVAVKPDSSDVSFIQATVIDMKTLFGTAPDTEVLMDLLAEQSRAQLAEQYGAADMTKGTVLFAGEERPSFSIRTSLSGTELYEQGVMVRQEDYLAMIMASSTQESTVEELLAHFQPTVDEKTEEVLDAARLLVNQGKWQEAMDLLRTAADSSDDPMLETAILRLENSRWRKISQKVFNSTDGSISFHYVYGYNDAGRCSVTESYSPEGELKSREVYEFDSNGFPCGTTIYDAEGNVMRQTEIDCDELGNIARMKGSLTFVYSNNPYGDCTEIARYEEDGTEFNRTFYSFDEYGIWNGMVNLLDGTCKVLPYDSEYEFSDDGETLRIISRSSGTDTVAAEYELSFVPLFSEAE